MSSHIKPAPIRHLPTELRLRIFRLVLRHDAPLSPTGDREKINIAPLLLNKSLHHEALDAFYEVNSIRFHDPKQLSLLYENVDMANLIRILELVSPKDNKCWFFDQQRNLRKGFRLLRRLPKLKSVTLGSDELGPSYMTVRTYVEKILKIRATLTCVDIGHYRISGKYAHVHIKHRRMVEAWQDFKANEDGDALANLEEGIGSFLAHSDVLPFHHALSHDLRAWVSLHHESELSYNKITEEPNWASRKGLACLYGALKSSSVVCFMSAVVPVTSIGSPLRKFAAVGDVPKVSDLGPESGGAVLEWATEQLSQNLRLLDEEVEKKIEARAYLPI